MIEIINTLLEILMVVIATEAATNLLTKSEFSERFLRKPLFKRRHNRVCKFFHDLLDCGYCTSVWVAAVMVALYTTESFDYLVMVLVLHRLSNVLHFIIDWIDEKRSRDLNFISKGEEYEGLREEHVTPLGTHDEESGGSRTYNSTE